MEILKAKRKEAIKKFQRHEKDTGSSEAQIAVLTARIKHLTEHFRVNKKDHSSRRGLIKMVGKRHALLKYLRRTNPDGYHKLIAELGLRK